MLGSVLGGAKGALGKFKSAADLVTKAEDLEKIGSAGAAAAEGLETTAIGTETAADATRIPEEITLGPILLIIAAIAILAVGIYELVTHWTVVWSAVKTAVFDPIDFTANLIGRVVDRSGRPQHNNALRTRPGLDRLPGANVTSLPISN